MYTAKMQYLLFAALGLISGTVCAYADLFLPDNQWVVKFYPGVILGLFLVLAGRCVAGLAVAGRWRGMLLPVLAAVAGWRLAVDVGYDLGGSQLGFICAGALGGAMIALGLMSAWQIRGRRGLFVLIVTAAGVLGGLVFQILDGWVVHSDSQRLWAALLFGEWQTLLLAGIAVALHRSRR